MLVNPLQESLSGSLSRLAVVFLLPYLFLAPVETVDSFQAYPNNRGSWRFLCGSACRAGLFPRCEITYAQAYCQIHKGEEGDGEQRERRNPGTTVCQSVIWNGAFQNGHCARLFALGKLAYYWWFLKQCLREQLNTNSLGSTVGKRVSCLLLRSLVVFRTYGNVKFGMLVICDTSLTVTPDRISTESLLF